MRLLRVHRANASCSGLSAFALTTFVLSLINAGARGIAINNIVVGLAFFYGGTVQLLAGMWEFACGNTFGATAFSSYGGFWMSFAAILTPGFGIADAYTSKDAADQLDSALGLYLIGWMIFTFLLFVASLRSSIGLVLLFGFLTLTFALLAGGFLGSGATALNATKAGGIFGVITAFSKFPSSDNDKANFFSRLVQCSRWYAHSREPLFATPNRTHWPQAASCKQQRLSDVPLARLNGP